MKAIDQKSRKERNLVIHIIFLLLSYIKWFRNNIRQDLADNALSPLFSYNKRERPGKNRDEKVKNLEWLAQLSADIALRNDAEQRQG